MENFKTTFQQAQCELCDQQCTAQQAGFQANGIWCHPTKHNDHPFQEMAEALANLATATTSDCQVLQNLTNTVKELSNQIKAKDRQIEDLIRAMNSDKTMGNNNKSTRWEKKDCSSYCHTHGYLVGSKHNSETYRQPGPNHNRNASCQNPMGANMEGKQDTSNTCRRSDRRAFRWGYLRPISLSVFYHCL